MLVLLASCLVSAQTPFPSYRMFDHPLASYDRVLCWHQVWDGSDWKWTPADVCPICCHHVVPHPVAWPDDCLMCPECSGVVSEIAWDRFNVRRVWWVGWPSETTTIGRKEAGGRW